MFNLEALGKLLLVAGAFLALTGLVLFLLSRLGLGRLPGDILIQKEHFTFYFPLATSILISIILTIVFNLIRR